MTGAVVTSLPRQRPADARWSALAFATAALLALLAGGCGASGEATHGEPLRVGAASDLLPAFTELGEGFEDATGIPVVFSFGSSGQLAQQLIEGAPMDLYASAHVDFVDRVVAEGVGDPTTQVTYAYGHLALWSLDATWGGWEDLDDLADDVASGAVGSVAIANPEHAPYGRAAEQALRTAGVWEAVRPHLVLGENIADTHRLAASGNADAVITALPLAMTDDEDAAGTRGRWVAIDTQLHDPLQQDLLVTATDPERVAQAQRFADHVLGDEGQTVLRRLGWASPDGAAAGGG